MCTHVSIYIEARTKQVSIRCVIPTSLHVLSHIFGLLLGDGFPFSMNLWFRQKTQVVLII